MSEFRTGQAPAAIHGAAFASFAQGIPVARIGWSDYERSSASSGCPRRHSEGAGLTGPREAQTTDVPHARCTASFGIISFGIMNISSGPKDLNRGQHTD